jgi:hypothetical protein
MKRFLVVALALLVASVAVAQVNVASFPVKFSNLTYAANESDTSSSQMVAGSNRLSLVVTSADSANLQIITQYYVDGATWTTKTTDTLLTIVASGASKEISLIDSDSDALDGVAYGVRVIVKGLASGCGVTGPTFTAKWFLKP